MSQNHYATLGVGSDASPEQLRAQRRRLEVAYHPDKFARDAEGQQSADAAFKRAKEAYEVLGDEATRAIYDRFGDDGVEEARQMGLIGERGDRQLSTHVQQVARTPEEKAQLYAEQRSLRQEKELEAELGLNSGINLRINAAQLFAKQHPGVDWEEDLVDRVSSVEINSLDMSSNMYTKVDERDSTYIGGFTGMRANGTGMGSVMAVWMRKWSKYRSSDVTLVCGDQQRLTGASSTSDTAANAACHPAY